MPAADFDTAESGTCLRSLLAVVYVVAIKVGMEKQAWAST